VLVSRVPARARRYVQFALIVAGLITVIAVPLITRRDSQPTVKAILLRNYTGGLTILLGIVAAVSLVLYAIRVARDERSPRDR
jgi:O-antigen/teichoic acid export membrane protein